MSELSDTAWIELLNELKTGDEHCRPIEDRAAVLAAKAFELVLWRAGVDIPAELRKFISDGSIDRLGLVGSLRAKFEYASNNPGLASNVARLQRETGVDVDRLLVAFAGYVRLHGDRDPTAGWKALTSSSENF